MRIVNKKEAEGDLEMYYGGLGKDASTSEELYFRWLQQVWLPTLFKTDPGWAFPVTAEEPPSLLKGIKLDIHMYVDLPVHGKTRIYEQSEWDIKDAQKGILFYYSPTRGTLHQFSAYLANLRDYLRLDVFHDKPIEYDVRKHTVAVVEVAAERWHAEEVVRRNRQLERDRVESIKLSLEADRDFLNLCTFRANGGKEYVLVRLMTPDALRNESNFMQHCVHGYYDDIYNGRCVILSIREATAVDRPILTAELRLPSDEPLDVREPYKRNVVQVRAPYNGDANNVIPRIVENLPVILRGLERRVLGPIVRSSSLTFKV